MKMMCKLHEVIMNKYDLYVNRPRIRLFNQNRMRVLTKVCFLTELMYPVKQDSSKSVFLFINLRLLLKQAQLRVTYGEQLIMMHTSELYNFAVILAFLHLIQS